MSSFSGLSVALSSLQTQRRAMDVTAQNIANANTPGYTRQRAELRSLGPNGAPGVQGAARMTGDGVQASTVVRLNDPFATARLSQETSGAEFLAARHATLSRVETGFHEPGEDGLAARLGELSTAWADVANNPDDVAARAVLLADARTVVDQIGAGHAAVTNQWSATRTQVAVAADEVNGLAAQVVDLNSRIRLATVAHQPANELADARDQLTLKLSGLTGATVRAGADGMVDVLIGSSALVQGLTAATVGVAGGTSPGGAPVGLQWADGRPVEVAGGSIAAGLGSLNTDLPAAAAGYDAVAAALTSGVNALHRGGRDLDGNPGADFFAGTDAASLRVAVADPRRVAAAGPQGGFDGSVADAISESSGAAGGPERNWSAFVSGFGAEVAAAGRRADTAELTRSDAAGALASTAGVDIDEEMTNLVQFQRAYQGAARVLTAIDEALDTLVNRTGVVGR